MTRQAGACPGHGRPAPPAGAKLLLAPERIARRVGQMAGDISAFMAQSHRPGQDWVVLGVLRGAFVFMADLVRRLSQPVEIDFIQVGSYGDKMESSGSITLLRPPTMDLAGRSILLVDDILDTGNSMVWLVNYLNGLNAGTIRTCVLLDKPACRKSAVSADYVGFSLPPAFVVGYGLDAAQKYRQLPGIYQLP